MTDLVDIRYLFYVSLLVVLFVLMPFTTKCSFVNHELYGTDNLQDTKHIRAEVLKEAKIYGHVDKRRKLCTGCVEFLSMSSGKRKGDEEHHSDISARNEKVCRLTNGLTEDYLIGADLPLSSDRKKNEVASQTLSIETTDVNTQTVYTERADSNSQTDMTAVDVDCLLDRIHVLESIVSNQHHSIENLNMQIKKMHLFESENDKLDIISALFPKYSNILNISGHFQYDLQDLLHLSVDNIYEKQPPLLRKFIDCLTQNDIENENCQNIQKRKFRKCLAIELLISAKHLRYISPLSFAPLIHLYNTCGSKTAVDIFSHTLPSGSYTFLKNWLLFLKPDNIETEQLHCDLMYALDNNQRLQKVWLSRNCNKQTLEVMTNIIKIELNGHTNQQNATLHPKNWRIFLNLDIHINTLTENQALDFLKETFAKVFEFTEQNTDKIQNLISEEETKSKFIQCMTCNKRYEKRKIKCDTCKTNIRHGTSAEEHINTKVIPTKKISSLEVHNCITNTDGDISFTSETLSNIQNTCNPLYNTKTKLINENISPKIHLLDPVFVNPASKTSLKVVLNKIAADAGIGTGLREFVYVVCDGSPMTLLWQIILDDPDDYSWVVPITGLGHEEMNMVRSFTEMFFDFILKRFFETQGYTTPKSLAFAKRCSDHHIAFDNLFKLREAVWMELIYSFIHSKEDVVTNSFDGFLHWLKHSNDQTLFFICSIMLPCLESLIIFRNGVRTNNSLHINLARSIFRQVWYGRHHTKYMIIDIFDFCSRHIMPQEILNCISKNESFSRSGRMDAHQGLNFILEEYNRNIKKHISGIANSEKWETVTKNYDSLQKLTNNINQLLGITEHTNQPRQVNDYTSERDLFRIVLRKSEYLFPHKNRNVSGIDSTKLFSQNVSNFTKMSYQNMETILSDFIKQGKYPSPLRFSKIPVSKEEETELQKDENQTKLQLLAMIDENLNTLPIERTKRAFRSTEKNTEIQICKKIRYFRLFRQHSTRT